MNKKFAPLYSVYEKIQMTAFSIQELTISLLYIYQTRKVLRPGEMLQRQKSHTRSVMQHLVLINLVIIVLDLGLLGTEYANLYEIEAMMKPAVYSIKLRLEFSILNQLMMLVQGEG